MANKINIKKTIKTYLKTNGHCAYCGKDLSDGDMSIDHITAKSNNGDNGLNNLAPACITCNKSKKAKSLEEFRIYKAKQLGQYFDSKQLKHLKEKGIIFEPVKYLFWFEINRYKLDGYEEEPKFQRRIYKSEVEK